MKARKYKTFAGIICSSFLCVSTLNATENEYNYSHTDPKLRNNEWECPNRKGTTINLSMETYRHGRSFFGVKEKEVRN